MVYQNTFLFVGNVISQKYAKMVHPLWEYFPKQWLHEGF